MLRNEAQQLVSPLRSIFVPQIYSAILYVNDGYYTIA